MLNVTNVIKNSPADKIGIKPGDILLNINNETCTDFIDYEFLTSVSNLSVKYKNTKGKIVAKKVRKPEHEENLPMEKEVEMSDSIRSLADYFVVI